MSGISEDALLIYPERPQKTNTSHSYISPRRVFAVTLISTLGFVVLFVKYPHLLSKLQQSDHKSNRPAWELILRSPRAALPGWPAPHNPAYLVTATHGAVATENKLCSDLGVDILKRGGNAMDASVTGVLCTGVVNMFR